MTGNWRLIGEDGAEVKVGDKATTFRGETVIVTGGTPPRRAPSTGRVFLSGGEYYPSVIGAKWVKEEAECESK